MAIYIDIGALVLAGWSLCINHSHLHWGAGLGRLVAYASVMAIYIGALTDYVPRAPNKATETRFMLLNLQGSSSPAVLMPTLLSRRPSRNIKDDLFSCIIPMFSCIFSFFWLCHFFSAYVRCYFWLCHCCPAYVQCFHWLSDRFPAYVQCFIGYVVVVLHFSNVSIGCLIVFLHRSSVFIDFRKGREELFKTNDWST